MISLPLDFLPFAGMVIAAAFRALGTAKYLHEPVSPLHFVQSTLNADRMWNSPFCCMIVLQGENHDQGPGCCLYRGAQVGLQRYARAYIHNTSLLDSSFCAIVFGFTAALAERIPIIGLIFSVSNRIGAAMWAHGMNSIQLLV